jgi:DnaJ-class molecular chaperone
MKNLKYIKEDCFLCRGSGEIKVSPDDLVVCLSVEVKICPICLGNGNLIILNTEEIKNE